MFVKEMAEKEKASLYDTMKNYIDDPVFKGSGAVGFVGVIEKMRKLAETAQVSELLQKLLIETGYERYVRESGEMERLDNVTELIRSIVELETEFGETMTLSTFLQEVSLNKDNDEDESKDCVKIMTTHISKGLEFPIVIVAGMSEKIFPSARALEERREKALEEERRLCYVAMTRAMKRLILTESEGVGFQGNIKTPSRFLFDIDDKYITRIGNISDEIMAELSRQAVIRRPSYYNRFEIGEKVKHKVFGEGVVEAMDEAARSYSIRFINGIKPIRFDFQGLSKNI